VVKEMIDYDELSDEPTESTDTQTPSDEVPREVEY